MKISRNWLQTFFEKALPDAEVLERTLTFGAFEIEGVERVGDDDILDVKVLPNRAHDCLSHRGIAKELATLLALPMQRDPLREPEPVLEAFGDFAVSVEKSEACPVYHGMRITGVRVGESPAWLRQRLESVGQRSINNVVDATNFVMLELGQPLHAFAADKIADGSNGKALGVRMAHAGEEITVLGGTSYTLTDAMQVIVDGTTDVALGIAGVKGGTVAEVDAQTTDIILESAKFHPTLTRKTAQALKLRTDASYRFENEIPDELPAYALNALATLIKDSAGGEITAYAGVVRQRAPLPFKIGVSAREVQQMLGVAVSDDTLESILQRYGFAYEKITDARARLVECARSVIGAPYKRLARIRFDTPEAFNCSSLTAWCALEAGWSITIARIAIDQFMYMEAITEAELQPGDFVFTNTGEERTKDGEMYSAVLDSVVRDVAIRTETLEYMPGTNVGHGVDHVGIYAGDGKIVHAGSAAGGVVEEILADSATFTHEKWYRRLITHDETRFVITVPFERLDMRLPADVIEEIGRVYGYENIASAPLPDVVGAPEAPALFDACAVVRQTLASKGFVEVYSYTLRDTGKRALLNALAEDKLFLRENLRDGVTEALTQGEYHAPFLGVSDVLVYEIGTVFDAEQEYTHVCVGVRLGAPAKRSPRTNALLLEVKDALQDALGVQLDVAIGEETLEFDVGNAITGKTYTRPSYVPVALDAQYTAPSAYPFVLRDIAVWIPDGAGTGDDVVAVIRAHAGALYVRADMFDTFAKEGRTSYAYHIVFQSREKTLTDVEIGVIMDAITSDLNSREGWEVR